MKSLQSISLFLFALIIFCSCEVDEQKKLERLQTDVINIHDEVMPKMDKIMQLQRSLKTLKADTSEILPSDKRILADNMISNLEKASESMMNWMRNYDSIMPGMSEEEKIAYLKKQEIAIKQVKQEMLSAISEASEFLKSNTE